MAAEGPEYAPPSLPPFSSRACCKVVLLLIVSGFCVNLTSMGPICGSEPYLRAFLPGSGVHGARCGVRHVIVLRAFSKAKIPYYPNSSATYSTRTIILSGDVELNPGMTNGNGNSTRTGINRKQRSINIAHLNVRSLKNKLRALHPGKGLGEETQIRYLHHFRVLVNGLGLRFRGRIPWILLV